MCKWNGDWNSFSDGLALLNKLEFSKVVFPSVQKQRTCEIRQNWYREHYQWDNLKDPKTKCILRLVSYKNIEDVISSQLNINNKKHTFLIPEAFSCCHRQIESRPKWGACLCSIDCLVCTPKGLIILAQIRKLYVSISLCVLFFVSNPLTL